MQIKKYIGLLFILCITVCPMHAIELVTMWDVVEIGSDSSSMRRASNVSACIFINKNIISLSFRNMKTKTYDCIGSEYLLAGLYYDEERTTSNFISLTSDIKEVDTREFGKLQIIIDKTGNLVDIIRIKMPDEILIFYCSPIISNGTNEDISGLTNLIKLCSN